jgi:CRP/FNR family transcriptional regulator, cyclic AMP receptor protein
MMGRANVRDSNDAILSAEVEGTTTLECAPGQHVFVQGDAADAAFLIRRGQFTLSTVSPAGKIGIIGIARAGDFLGEACLHADRTYGNTASAVTPGTVVRLPRSAVERSLVDDPRFAARFVQYLVSRTTRLEERLLDHIFSCSETRLARVLVELASAGGPSLHPIVPRPSHETLAALVGTTRPRVSLFMRRFKALGFIESAPGRLHVRPSLLSAIRSASRREPEDSTPRSSTAPRERRESHAVGA